MPVVLRISSTAAIRARPSPSPSTTPTLPPRCPPLASLVVRKDDGQVGAGYDEVLRIALMAPVADDAPPSNDGPQPLAQESEASVPVTSEITT